MIKYYKNVLEILLENAEKFPNKIIFEDEKNAISYKEFVNRSVKLGNEISKRVTAINRPIALYVDQTINSLIIMFAILFSGNYYCVLDTKSPTDRIERIINILNPALIVCDKEIQLNTLKEFADCMLYIEQHDSNCEQECDSWKFICDSDPAYILFTSGSTGIPKGSVISHKSVIAYTASVKNAFDIDQNTVFGNQTPFYFSMSVLDIYSTIYNAATLVIIPKKYFAFPKNLIEYINEKKVNSIYWVPTAYNICVRRKIFDIIKVKYLRLVMFAGETMPSSCIGYWQRNVEHATFANLFGPTEITDTGTYHILKKIYDSEESIPIGRAFDNCEVFVIDENGKKIEASNTENTGELYYRGSFVGNGYYASEDITSRMFVQNPLNDKYIDIVFKSGDRVKYNMQGDLVFIGRMDNQIKHNGYRIELGEIERVANSIEVVEECACIYVENNIVLYIVGNVTDDMLMEKLIDLLPKYMVTQKIITQKNLPKNSNGKIDRKKIIEEYKNGK